MARLGFGISITFQSGFFAEITDVDHDGIERGDVDTSSMATTNNAITFTPEALYDPGGLSVNIWFEPNTSIIAPITAAAETVTITFPLKSGQTNKATWAFTGYMSKFKWGGKVKGLMTASVTIKASGPITITPGS